MLKRAALALSSFALLATATVTRAAVDEIRGAHVTALNIDPAAMPEIYFTIDANSAAVFSGGPSKCPAGTWLRLVGSSTDGFKVNYAALLASQLSGHSITVFLDTATPTTTCRGATCCTIISIHVK